jgi:phosphatidylserine decarboxylase
MNAFLADSRPRLIDRVVHHDGFNFLVTNRIPRRLLTMFMGWFSRIEQPLVRDLSLATWKLFAPDLDLDEAATTQFRSLHDCFVRELKPGARPIDPDPDVVVSPCDALVGAMGTLEGLRALQAKDSAYTLEDLLGSPALAEPYRDGSFVTLRLTSTMYHHFHAPADCGIDGLTYVAGDTWNVNRPALLRVPRLFCRNERAILPLQLRDTTASVVLVPVAAILVASLRFTFLPTRLHLRYDGLAHLPCEASFRKGDRMGHFEHGSTIIVIAARGLEPCGHLHEGMRIRVGEPLLRRVHG